MDKEISNLTVKVDKELKEQVQKVLSDLGTNQSAIINMLFKQIVIQKKIPFEITLKN